MAATLTAPANAVENASALLGGLFALLAPQRKLPQRLRSVYGRTVTDRVLAARDLQDLNDHLDALSGDSEFWLQEKAPDPPAPPTVEQALKDLEASSLDMHSLAAVLGTAGADRCQEGHTAWKSIGRRAIEWTQGLQRFVENLRKLYPSAPAAPRPPAVFKTIGEVLFGSELPLAVREELAALLQTFAAAAVIGRAEERGERLEPWLARGLADAFARTPERILANMRFERLPALLSAVLSSAVEKAALEEVVGAWRRDAEGNGQGVYFPLDTHGHAQA